VTPALAEAIDRALPLLAEGKSYGSRRSRSAVRAALNAAERALRPEVSRSAVREAEAAYAELKSGFEDALQGLLGAYEAEDVTKAEFRRRMQEAIRDHYEAAYRVGLRRAGGGPPVGSLALEAEDLAWLKGAAKEEGGYARAFIDAVEDGTSRMDPARRMQMYVDTLDGIYRHGQVDAYDETTQIVWALGVAEHCRTCITFAAGSPYTKATLPATPGDGTSECKCITTPWSRVLTDKGWIPIGLVEPGALVWTHRQRWRRVTARIVRPSGPEHRQAFVRSPSGEFVGCTADHWWLTSDGWKDTESIEKYRLQIYSIAHAESLHSLLRCDAVTQEIRSLPVVRECLPLRDAKALDIRTMSIVRDATQSSGSMGFAAHRGCESAEEVCGSSRGTFPQCTQGRALLRDLLDGGWQGTDKFSLDLAMAEHERSGSAWLSNPSYQWRSDRRPDRKPIAHDHRGPSATSFFWVNESQVERWADAANMRPLPHGVQNLLDAEILLNEMLPPSTPLYDLSIEDDHSFVIEGLVSHNSNCRCRLIFRPGQVEPEAEEAVRGGPPREDLPPKGFRRPTEQERAFIENLTARITFSRELTDQLAGPQRRAEILARQQMADRLVRFLEERKIWQRPTWAAGNRAHGQAVDRGALEEVLKGRDLTGEQLRRLRRASRGDFDDVLDRFEAAVAARREAVKAAAGDRAAADEIERAANIVLASALTGPVSEAGEPEPPDAETARELGRPQLRRPKAPPRERPVKPVKDLSAAKFRVGQRFRIGKSPFVWKIVAVAVSAGAVSYALEDPENPERGRGATQAELERAEEVTLQEALANRLPVRELVEYLAASRARARPEAAPTPAAG